MIQLMNKHPKVGPMHRANKLKQLNREERRLLAIQEHNEQLDEVVSNARYHVDRYLADLMGTAGGSTKVANVLIKWIEGKEKNAEGYNPLAGEE